MEILTDIHVTCSSTATGLAIDRVWQISTKAFYKNELDYEIYKNKILKHGICYYLYFICQNLFYQQNIL